MQKTALDERIRSAKPDYVQLDKEKLVSQVVRNENIARAQKHEKRWWTGKKLIASIIIPVAALSAVGFTQLPKSMWIRNGSVNAYTGQETQQQIVDGIKKSMGGFYTKSAPFIQAKHTIPLPKDQIFYAQRTGVATQETPPQAKEVILMGIPFIRMDIIQKDNYAIPGSYTSLREYFLPAKHAISLPANEIARSDNDQNANTKEILIPGKQPLIRWDVISPDNNANY